jgi:hypothetical protein
MAIPETHHMPWTRQHDEPGVPLVSDALTIAYPQSLNDLIELCTPGPTRSQTTHIHAAGSHWALSRAAVSDALFLETNDVQNIVPALGRTLYDVVPACLSEQFLEALNASSRNEGRGQASSYLVHVESGKRIYQLYAELDQGDAGNKDSLASLMKERFDNNRFAGQWGFATLGGAGGQTVLGALTTGTHGGDFDRGPVADSVMALHVVGDGGKHFWIERTFSNRDADIPEHFTDEAKLRALYGAGEYGGPENFEVIYSNDVLDAALVQVGRFGAVYSIVLEAVKQYVLREQVELTSWEAVKRDIHDPQSTLFTKTYEPAPDSPIEQHFLQLAVCPIPSDNGNSHVCGLTRRWTIPLARGAGAAGRAERVGPELESNNARLNAPLFENAGTSFPYKAKGGYSFDLVCANPSVSAGAVELVYREIENFLKNHVLEIGGALAVAAAAGADLLLPLAPLLLLLLAFLAAFLEAAKDFGPKRLGEALNDLRAGLLEDPTTRPAGVLVWRAIATKVFEDEQAAEEFEAISYAVMDGHNYRDRSCNEYADSVEVFFDAEDPNLIAFVDRLLMFESDQEWNEGHSVAGYISLRFTGATQASIGPEAFERTCAVECSGLADVDGTAQFVRFAEMLALDPNIKGILHWGQSNESTQRDIEFRFGDTPEDPTGPLQQWRRGLARLTENGRHERFTSEFTRRTGLEIVQPVIATFGVSASTPGPPPSYTLSWDCTANPRETSLALSISSPSGAVQDVGALAHSGTHTLAATEAGDYTATLTARLERNGVARDATETLTVAAT